MTMNYWTQQLKHDPSKSEVASTNDLAIRYAFEKDVIGSTSIKKEDVWNLKELKSILRKQNGSGSWSYKSNKSDTFSKMDYDLYETVIVLARLIEMYGIDISNFAVQRAAEYLLSHQSSQGDIRLIYANQYSPNYSAMVAELLIKAGYSDDQRVIKILDWLIASRQQDGGWALPFRTKGLNLQVFSLGETIEADTAKPSSAMVTGVVLRAMAIHSSYRNRKEVIQAAQYVADSMFTADNYPDRKGKEYWTRFGYPFIYTDLVSALDSLSLIGGFENHRNIRKAVKWLKDHQTTDGLFDLRTTRGNKEKQKMWMTVAIYRIIKRLNVL